MNEPAYTLGKLSGFLLAFEHLNRGPDHGPTYTLEPVAWKDDPTTSLRHHFGSCTGLTGGSWAVAIESLGESPEVLRPLLLRWFFDQHLGMPLDNYGELWQAIQENCVNEFLSLVSGLFEGHSPRVWKVVARPPKGQFYELVWDDVLLERRQRLFLLHLGMSD